MIVYTYIIFIIIKLGTYPWYYFVNDGSVVICAAPKEIHTNSISSIITISILSIHTLCNVFKVKLKFLIIEVLDIYYHILTRYILFYLFMILIFWITFSKYRFKQNKTIFNNIIYYFWSNI